MFLRRLSRSFSKALDITVVDTSSMLNGRPSAEQCKKVVEGFYKHGVIAIKDPRVDEEKNQEFLELMQRYFKKNGDRYYRGENLPDARPEVGYQVGVTPELRERARVHESVIEKHFKVNKPTTPQPPPFDGKWRYFWRIGDVSGQDELLLAPQVIPKDFPEWETKMNGWGSILHDCCFTVSEMLALGLDMPRNQFTSLMKGGVQLLAPTGSDLTKYNKPGDVLAGFHYDLNFLTIHGKSNYPGLFVWLRNGEKVPVKIPDGCLLLQSSKMLEWMTGGYFYAGYHEVIVTEDTLKAVEKAKAENKSLWRVSSTMFSTLRYDVLMKPFPRFAAMPEAKNYPPILTYKHVEEELKAINLLVE